MTPSELFEFDVAPEVRGGLYVNQVPGESAVGQCADLGADDVFEGQHQAVLCVYGWPPECFLEDVDLALFTADRIGDDQARGQRVCFQSTDLPPALLQADAHGGRDVLHALGILGRNVEVLAEPVDQAVRLDRVAAGKRQRVRTAYGEHV
ncbi:hypothetical protein SAMN05216483_3345 [Streptomyces sp. 2131.1]|nr:hypothetical protein SAMN05216483_3345 [Streptomyces sp. 2131.1]